MAESFLNTFRRDYLACMDLSDAPTVIAQAVRIAIAL